MTESLYPYPGDDPLARAARDFFALSYLFPYQRLVAANILEAAEAAGVGIRWPGEEALSKVESAPGGAEGAGGSDRETLGRQIVVLPTGAGKSLCFQLPALLMEGPTLVIYPLLGLMADQERRLSERGFSPVTIRGGQTGEERDTIWKKIRSGESRFIIANPEVLLTPPVLERIKSLNIAHVVVDEAHTVSEWGESFRPAYLEIGRIIEAAGAPVVTAFTATAGEAVLDKIEGHIFAGRGAQRIVGNPDRKNIFYAARGCVLKDIAARDLLLRAERQAGREARGPSRFPAIVFCSSRRGTEKLARYLGSDLAERGVLRKEDVRFYHAGLSGEEKKETERWFLRGKDAVLVATCAYGLGIDKPDIRTVIHRDCPPSVEAYLQESGRAGRDGLASEAMLLWGPEDARGIQKARTPGSVERFSRLLSLARDTSRCRREALLDLLDYEGERDSPGTPCCDVCEKEARACPREEKSVVDFFRRNRRSYTAGEAARILARAKNLRWSEKDAGEAIDYFLKAGKLKRSGNWFWKDKIGPNLKRLQSRK